MEEKFKKFMDFCGEYPVFTSVWISLILALPMIIFGVYINCNIGETMLITLLVAMYITYPIVLSVINIVSVFTTDTKWNLKIFEWIGIVLGGLYSVIYMETIGEGWWGTVCVGTVHTPIADISKPILIVIVLIAFVGYAILSLKGVEKLPPLVAVLSILAMYMGCVVAVVWCVKTFSEDFMLSVYPINCILLAVKRTKTAVVFLLKSEKSTNECIEN
jgi:hypothetical protein